MPSVERCRHRKHHSLRLLQHQHREAPSIQVPNLREDILRERRNALPSTPTIQHRRATFDEVARLSVEGLNKSAIARVKRIAWNTVARWLEKAAHSCRRFNDRRIATLAVVELQADEIRTIAGTRNTRSGSSPPLTYGLGFGLGPSWGDEATETRLLSFKT